MDLSRGEQWASRLGVGQGLDFMSEAAMEARPVLLPGKRVQILMMSPEEIKPSPVFLLVIISIVESFLVNDCVNSNDILPVCRSPIIRSC